MRRNNPFSRISLEELVLSHLFERQLISRFIFLRDNEQPVMRAVIQTKLAEHIPSFLVSSHGKQPPKMVGFLNEVVDA